MMNMFRNKFNGKRQSGFAMLTVGLIVLTIVTVVSIGLSVTLVGQQHRVNDEYSIKQALNAALAGLEYAVVNATQNYATLADQQTLTGTMSDGTRYSVLYTFQGSKSKIKITATGYSADNTATKIVNQSVQYVVPTANGLAIPTVPMAARSNLTLVGSSNITSTSSGNKSIISGSTVSYSGSAFSFSPLGVSSAGGVGLDVTQNSSTWNPAVMTDTLLQTQVLGQPITDFASSASPFYTYSNSSDYNYSTALQGANNVTIWINQTGGTAIINGTTTIGTPTNPVNIFVIGNVDISGNTIIYGNLIATGSVKLRSASEVNGLVFTLSTNGVELDETTGAVLIRGAVVSGGQVKLAGSSSIAYDSATLTTTMAIIPSAQPGSYAKIPGSWNDMGF